MRGHCATSPGHIAWSHLQLPGQRASPMTAMMQILLLLVAVLVLVAVIARRLNTAPSILLVIAGVGLALAPGLLRVEMAPELVLLGILPPLIYLTGCEFQAPQKRLRLTSVYAINFMP